MAALDWIVGRWRLTGTYGAAAVEGEHSFSVGYAATVLFFHEELWRTGSPASPVAESHGALASDPRAGGYALVTSHAGGALRLWRARRMPENLLLFETPAALNRADQPAARWTLRRGPSDRYESFQDRATVSGRFESLAVLSGTLARGPAPTPSSAGRARRGAAPPPRPDR